MDTTLATDSEVTVRVDAQAEPRLAIPVAALRQEAEGTFVYRQKAGASSASDRDEKVAITVVDQANGWLAVGDTPLRAGDKVRLAP